MAKKEELCDCGKRKARLVFACPECVPTENFPKGVERAQKFLEELSDEC